MRTSITRLTLIPSQSSARFRIKACIRPIRMGTVRSRRLTGTIRTRHSATGKVALRHAHSSVVTRHASDMKQTMREKLTTERDVMERHREAVARNHQRSEMLRAIILAWEKRPDRDEDYLRELRKRQRKAEVQLKNMRNW